MAFKILLVEDNESDIDAFSTTCERINETKEERQYEVQVARTIEEANRMIRENEFQGCVVDIKLKKNDNGNDFIKAVMERYRIPVVVYTGTPDVESIVKVFIKGEKTPEDVINELTEEDATGMFKVLGGTGEIEKNMTQLFWNVLYPQIDIWKEHHAEGKNTEEVLLRYIIAHLIELLDENGPSYCTEEMYIYGEMDNPIKTGSIFENKKTQNDYILLSPPCDLALREDGKINTDSLLLCEIEPIDWSKIKNEYIENIIENKKGEYYHWLPDNRLYKGGRINFRKLLSVPLSSFENDYKYLDVKIQSFFTKSVLQRFSAYYARQGQPDFDFVSEAKRRKKK